MTLFINTIPRPIDIPGGRFAGGMTIRSLLLNNGVEPSLVTFVQVTRVDAGQVALTQAQLGNARIVDDGARTRFVHGAVRITATYDTGPLQVSVNSGDIAVVASASRGQVSAGDRVSFSARVRFAPPGAQLSFSWDFGDGTAPRSGRYVAHVFKYGGDFSPRVTVTGTGGATGRCSSGCIGHDDVDVTVGDPPPEPPAPVPGSGGGTGGSTGSGFGSGSGTGQGGSGGATGAGNDPGAPPTPKPKPKTKPEPKPRKPFGVKISGVLINDPGTTVTKLPTGASGAPSGRRETQRGDVDATREIPLAVALALALALLGALRERRGVKLRLA